MDYFVPHFGVDHDDVVTSFNSLDVAENMRQHRWIYDPASKKAADEPTSYESNPDLDDDIIDTQAH
jgi:hypothetical protein